MIVKRDNEGHCIKIKGSIYNKDVMIINIYMPNFRAPQYRKQKLAELKREINSNAIIFGDSNILFSIIDRSENQ